MPPRTLRTATYVLTSSLRIVGASLRTATDVLTVSLCKAGALTTAELCDALGLQELKNRKWHVQGSIAIKGEGLYEVCACHSIHRMS